MSLVQALSESVVEKYPEFGKLNSIKQKNLINKTLQSAIKTALTTIELPSPKDRFRRKMDEFLHKRHRPHFREEHKLADYDLIEQIRQLRKEKIKNLDTDITTDSSELSINSSLIDSQTSSSSKIFTKPQFDYSYYPHNSTHGRHSFFKSEFNDKNFSSKTSVQNVVTRLKFKLEESLNDIYETIDKNGLTFYSKQKDGHSKIYISTSLFQLYELHQLLIFIKTLEEKIKIHKKREFISELSSAYKLIHDYYRKWLSYHGIEISKNTELQKSLFLNDEFMKLDKENPLFEGFTILMIKTLDYKKIAELMKEKSLKRIFSIKKKK